MSKIVAHLNSNFIEKYNYHDSIHNHEYHCFYYCDSIIVTITQLAYSTAVCMVETYILLKANFAVYFCGSSVED